MAEKITVEPLLKVTDPNESVEVRGWDRAWAILNNAKRPAHLEFLRFVRKD